MAERGGRGGVAPTYVSPCLIITDGYGQFSNVKYVITDGYSIASPTGNQGVFGPEDGMNSTIFGGMVVR